MQNVAQSSEFTDMECWLPWLVSRHRQIMLAAYHDKSFQMHAQVIEIKMLIKHCINALNRLVLIDSKHTWMAWQIRRAF